MILIEDTRQKSGKHGNKKEYWKKAGDKIIRCKLPFGDYSLPPKVAVDTKQNILEIATNMCGSANEKRRFREECKLARDAGCRLIFLIECRSVKLPEDLIGKKIRLISGKTIPGEQLALAMRTMENRYGCSFEFCDPENSGKKIIELLGGGNDQPK